MFSVQSGFRREGASLYYDVRWEGISLPPGGFGEQFLATRGFRVWEEQDGVRRSKRGHLLGNLASYDMTKLRATITVVDQAAELSVNANWQDLIQSNQVSFVLELWAAYRLGSFEGASSLEEALQRTGIRTEMEWFRTQSIRDAMTWSFTGMARGRDLNDASRQRIATLTDGWQPNRPNRHRSVG